MPGMRRKRIYLEILIALAVIVGAYAVYQWQENNFDAYLANAFPSPTLALGQVVSVQLNINPANAYPIYDVAVKFLTGASQGQTTTVVDEGFSSSTATNYLPFAPGEKVILAPSTLSGYAGQEYFITDRFRLPALLFIILIFAAVAIIFGRKRGLTSIVGLGASVVILGWYIVPQILHGADPLAVCIIGAAAIAIISLYLAHGFNKRTSVAVAGTLVTLGLSALVGVFSVSIAHLVGLASEESFYLHVGKNIILNLRGILLGGIVIGALGVLDDVTIGQSTAVAELKDANAAFDFGELYRRGMAIGREHIASLVNTLFLAYAGVALPVILYLAAFQAQFPLWLTLNGEPIAEEIVRTMVGSIGIILAVPITTALAAWAFGRKRGS